MARCTHVATSLIVQAFMVLSSTGQTLAHSGTDLANTLARGGNVIVMRHASSPQTPPSKEQAAPGNTKDERQLDEKGILSATEMGEAIRAHHLPVGKVFSSPTYRAWQTVKFAGLGHATEVAELGDNGVSMSSSAAKQASWLRNHVANLPIATNTFIVTHYPNILAAFPNEAKGLADGEALVFGSDGKGGVTLLARIRIEEWSRLPNQPQN